MLHAFEERLTAGRLELERAVDDHLHAILTAAPVTPAPPAPRAPPSCRRFSPAQFKAPCSERLLLGLRLRQSGGAPLSEAPPWPRTYVATAAPTPAMPPPPVATPAPQPRARRPRRCAQPGRRGRSHRGRSRHPPSRRRRGRPRGKDPHAGLHGGCAARRRRRDRAGACASRRPTPRNSARACGARRRRARGARGHPLRRRTALLAREVRRRAVCRWDARAPARARR